MGANFKVKEPIQFLLLSGADMNKIYDLHGDNAYQNKVYHTIIPFDCVNGDAYAVKSLLKARYFNDVVDNNEYREYIAGRHKKTEKIQWIIDIKGDRIEESYSVKLNNSGNKVIIENKEDSINLESYIKDNIIDFCINNEE